MCQRLLMLWVILFFYFGVLNLKATLSAGANLEGFGPLLLSTVHLPLLGSCFASLNWQVNWNSSVQCYCVLWAYRCFCQCFSHLPTRTVQLGSLHRRLVLLRYSASFSSYRVSITGRSTRSI